MKIYESKPDDAHKATIVEFLRQEGSAFDWEHRLKELAKSDRPVIFRVNYIDDNGLVFVLIQHWLQYTTTQTAFVETSVPGIRNMLKLLLEDRVAFTDNE